MVRNSPFAPFASLMLAFGCAPLVLDGATVVIDADTTYQTVEGLGASGVSNRLFYDQDFMDFVAYDLGFSLYRMPIEYGISDPQDEADDIRWEDFDLSPLAGGDLVRQSIAFTKGMQFRRPETRLIATAWTPPAWMKDNQSTTGTRSGFIGRADADNRLSDDKYDHYARFLFEYAEMFEGEGIPFFALSPANELMFTQTFQSCVWYPDEYARIIRRMGETFASEGAEKPLFFGPEDMTFATYETSRHRPYVDALMADGVAEYFDVFATHGYTDGFSSGNSFDPKEYWNAIKRFDRPYWLTEGGTGGHDWPEPIETGIAARIHHALVGGNVSVFAAWQITDVQPNEHGVMADGVPTKKTYGAMHYWRFIRPGFVRIDADLGIGDASGLQVSAFRDPAGERLVVVVINAGDSAQTLEMSFAGDLSIDSLEMYQTTATTDFESVGTLSLTETAPTATLPAGSITTFANEIPVESITLAPETLRLDLGAQGQLSRMITPAIATYPKLSFSSSDESVATVNRSGVVAAHGRGSAVITATAVDGGAASTVDVEVSFLDWAGWPVVAEAYVDTGDAFLGWIYAHPEHDWVYSFKRSAWLYLPEEAVNGGLIWTYFLNPEGVPLQTAHGSTTEATSVGDGSGVADTNVLLNQSVTVSSLAAGSAAENLVDDSYGFTGSDRWITSEFPQWAKIDLKGRYEFSEFRLYPWENRGYLYSIDISDNDVDYTRVVDRTTSNSWSSVHVDSVDATGRYVLLSVVGGGEYTGTWVNIHELQGMGHLIPTPVSGLNLKPATLERGVGQTYQLDAWLEPEIATNKAVSWSSSDSSVATVDQSGLVTTVGQGEATISVVSEDGKAEASCLVTVGDSAMWSQWPVAAESRVETGAFAGPIFAPASTDWVYLYDLERWAYLPEKKVQSFGAWVGIAR